jgi:gliding motility-associated lipoprotein GldH
MNLPAKPNLIFFIATIFLAVSCTSLDVFEQNVSFKKQEWPGSDKPVFSFNITDTASLYNIYLVLRHTNAYDYNNIWLNFYRQGPDTGYTRQIDLRLANNEKGWLGSGMDDIWEHRIKITDLPVQFRKSGNYRFTLQQIMRQDPLQHMLNVGLRIEKAR